MVKRNGQATIEATALSPVSNGGATVIEMEHPYKASVTIQGVAPIMFHGWNNEAVSEKAKAAKGSKAKKSDDVESYIYRTANGNIGIRGDALRGAIIGAAKFRQDPRSPRKSASDLVKAGLWLLTDVADTGVPTWDYLDRRRVRVQQNSITRERPVLKDGWTATFEIVVNLPEYISPAFLQDLIMQGGRLCGLYEMRPTYGRFVITHWDISSMV